jgi:hypothetical protein
MFSEERKDAIIPALLPMAALRKIHPVDWIAFLLSIATVFLAYLVADQIYERMPHFEDEMAYVWQAQAIAGGDLILPSPPNPKSFLTPFVIDYHGARFSKYPPGWPTVLALGFLTGLEVWINPLLAGMGIWLFYLLARCITTRMIGLLSVLLMLTSPMFWLLSGSLLSHAWSLVLTLGFILAWLDTFHHRAHGEHGEIKNSVNSGYSVVKIPPRWLTVIVAGLSLGVLGVTRPIDAVAVGLPFVVHGLVLLVRGDRLVRKRVLAIGLLAAGVGALIFAWQFALTGDPLLNPYTLWWKYDKFGFGLGHGRWEDGHTLEHAWKNLEYSLLASPGTGGDILGWGNYWWIFLPFGLWALRREPAAWLVAAVFPALLLVYLPYWIGSWQYGPRYYFEGMLSIAILSAAGAAWLAGDSWRIRKILVALVLALLMGINLFTYLPSRLWKMHGMYNIDRAMLDPFLTTSTRELTPALVLVHNQKEWTEYGGLLELQNAQLTTPFIFALYRRDALMADYQAAFPERRIYHYYPDEPFTFYPIPR